MMTSDLLVLALLAAIAVAGMHIAPALRAQQTPQDGDTPADTVFLFHGQQLRDMTAVARQILPPDARTRDDVAGFLSLAFPDLSLRDIGPAGLDRRGRRPDWRITATEDGDILRVTVTGLHDLAEARHANDLALLDEIKFHSPQLIWQLDRKGHVIWSNTAYGDLVAEVGPPDGVLFDNLDNSETAPVRLQPAGCDTRWFDIRTTQNAERITCFAVETTDLVRADENRREYVTTLGRTFGDLSTGLAIFDRNRQLRMFNPALLEMSKLPFAFLSTRPRIDAVFDRMRELQMMPEPKDYGSWREQFTAVETGARQGTYCETWPLADGQTFRVTGRPHPDGAFALLFEDITAELSLTRRFRAEIETSQAVLDSLPDAMAVFTHAGTLVITNAAYGALWRDEAPGLTHRTMQTEIARWRAESLGSPVWNDLRDTLRQAAPRKGWSRDILLTDGRPLKCHLVPLEGGMTLIRFAQQGQTTPILRKLTSTDPALVRRKG